MVLLHLSIATMKHEVLHLVGTGAWREAYIIHHPCH